MGFYEPHNRKWYYVELPVMDEDISHACFNGMYYMVDFDTGNTVVVNIACGTTFSVPPPDNLDVVYFVESAGKILRIAQRFDGGSVFSNFNLSFIIYQLDVIDKNSGYRWVKTSSIGNQIFFLEECNGISVATCETTGLRGNCIYYLQYCDADIFPMRDELYRYNIEDGQIEKYSLFLEEEATGLCHTSLAPFQRVLSSKHASALDILVSNSST